METIMLMVFSLLLGGGGGNDLLSLIPSDAYWKSKDIQITVPNILLELNSIKSDDTSKATAVHRLMAIRALGELKNADAIPSLKTQLDSKELFVADYAQRAIDAIQGNASAPTSGVPPDRMKADLYMLPEHCGAVAQLKMAPGKFVAPATQPAADEQAAGGDAKSQLEQMANTLIYIAEMTGNIRVDGVTLGVSDEIGSNQGFVIFIVRGKWDLDAVKSALQGVLPQTKAAGEEDFMTAQDAPVAVAVPSDELFVMTSGPTLNIVPLEDIGNAIKTGKGKFESSTDLIQTIGTIDTTAAASWAAMFVSDNYRQAPQLAAFDSLTLTGKKTDSGLSYEAKATGKDADAVKSAVDQLTSLVDDGKSELVQQSEQSPMLKPLADFLGSIELKSDGVNATGTAVMKSPGS